ncbi:MAG: ester cyclase, partial [Streptomyces sp.]|uniref:ester cyclase n=1 Tax=Streptomyces sp. TaxID=1931 RepID=UPI003D6A3A46
QLNKAAARRVFDELMGRDDPEGFNEVFAAGYHDHDVANKEAETYGPDGIRAEALGYRKAFPDFEFTIEDQVAENDCVVTRWSWTGTNTGEMRGMTPSGKKVEIVGTTTFRFENGKIAEGWWHWDVLGMMSQIGAVEMRA